LLNCTTARLHDCSKGQHSFRDFPPEAGSLTATTATTATIKRPLAAFLEKLIYFI